MNPDLDNLQPYPFERLAALKAGITPPTDRSHIALSIGEPRHATPAFLVDALGAALEDGLNRYAATRGEPELRTAIADWLGRRFRLRDGAIDPERQVLPVSGTREGLFSLAQAVIDRGARPTVLMPNPFYQIYEGAALLAGAEPVYLNTDRAQGHQPDLDAVPEAVWRRCQLVYACSPGNPSGAVLTRVFYRRLLELADTHGFVIAADECYSELYRDEDDPPPGLLQVCAELGRDDFRRCVVFHSLSKRSNAPGLRSGFVAGDAAVLERFLLYRTYHGCAMPLQVQRASIAAWRDEAHVRENRARYREKFERVAEILAPVLDLELPAAGFYLWPRLPMDDAGFARELFRHENVTVLPGQYLSRECGGDNPGRNHVRIALVAELEECIEAARRIRRFATRT
jgi:N-succinyldiaminopimelate aminotransferase